MEITTSAAWFDVLLLQLKGLVAGIVGIDVSEIGADDNLIDLGHGYSLGMDSLDTLKLSLLIAEEYDLDEPVDVTWDEVATVRQVAELVVRLIAGQQPR